MYKVVGCNDELAQVKKDIATMLNLQTKIVGYDVALMNSSYYTKEKLATIKEKRANSSHDFADLLNKYNIKDV